MTKKRSGLFNMSLKPVRAKRSSSISNFGNFSNRSKKGSGSSGIKWLDGKKNKREKKGKISRFWKPERRRGRKGGTHIEYFGNLQELKRGGFNYSRELADGASGVLADLILMFWNWIKDIFPDGSENYIDKYKRMERDQEKAEIFQMKVENTWRTVLNRLSFGYFWKEYSKKKQ